MPSAKTITISLPSAMGKEIEKVAKEEQRTVSELLRETFRQYMSSKRLKSLHSKASKKAKSKNITMKDLE
ncbi:MAG: CopG family transcriptional regulator [Oligoflexia bacterium]|nr:CopG family transcriptional regulator [Oligoflexia bacterium]